MACHNTLNFSDINAASAFVKRLQNDQSFTTMLMACILGVGMITNAAFLFTVLRVPRMRTIPNFYFALQSLTDILYLNIVISPILYAKRNKSHLGEIPTSSLVCVSYYFLMSTVYTVSLSLIFIVSFDRFYAITYPLRHKVYANTGRLTKLTATALTFSLLCSVVVSLNRATYFRTCYVWPNVEEFRFYPLYSHACKPLHHTTSIVKYILKTVPFLSAFVCISGFYIKIIRVLKDKSITKSASTLQQTSIRNQVARIVICNGIIFFICFLPSVVIETIHFIDPEGRYPRIYIGYCTIFFNSCLNTLSFPILSPFYRQAYRDAFYICRHCRQRQDERSDVTLQTVTVPPAGRTATTNNNV